MLLSDCVHNAGPDPRPFAARLPRLDVLLDVSGEQDLELARDLARPVAAASGRFAATGTWPRRSVGFSWLTRARDSARRKGYCDVMANTWFETVAEAQRRAKKRLPKSVYWPWSPAPSAA